MGVGSTDTLDTMSVDMAPRAGAAASCRFTFSYKPITNDGCRGILKASLPPDDILAAPEDIRTAE